jgi:membrane protease YdiL (CAAX protease family)
LTRVLVAFVVVFATYAAAFRPELGGRPAFFWAFGIPHVLLAAFALRTFAQKGTLATRLTPRGGDITWGALPGVALLAASWAARSVLVPTGTPRQAWLLRVFLVLGDPETLQHSVFLTSALVVIVIAEELIWRGLVLDELNARFGPRTGWVIAAALYAFAAVPTVYSLRDPFAGPNPLLVIAAFGCGLVWTFLAGRFERLLPSIVSHLVFTYFSAVQFRWPV